MSNPHVRRAATIAGTLIVAVIGLSWFVNKYFWIEAHQFARKFSRQTTLQEFESSRLRRVAGWMSRDCGYIRRHDDPADAIGCVKESLKSQKPFLVAFEDSGLDSRVASGIASNSANEVFEINTDEFGTEVDPVFFDAIARRVSTITKCKRDLVEITLFRGNRILSCSVGDLVEGSENLESSNSRNWHWSNDCEHPQLLRLQAAIDGVVVSSKTISVCQSPARNEPFLEFHLSGGRTYRSNGRGNYPTTRNQKIDLDVWEAASDPDGVILGVSFATKKQILVNAVHLAKPNAKSESWVSDGVQVGTYPICDSKK